MEDSTCSANPMIARPFYTKSQGHDALLFKCAKLMNRQTDFLLNRAYKCVTMLLRPYISGCESPALCVHKGFVRVRSVRSFCTYGVITAIGESAASSASRVNSQNQNRTFTSYWTSLMSHHINVNMLYPQTVRKTFCPSHAPFIMSTELPDTRK